MAKKGPGRPFKPKPGFKIQDKSQIGLPNDVFEQEFLKEILTLEEFNTFVSLPLQIKDQYISTIKNSLFKVSSKAVSTNVLNYGEDEFNDLAGVQVAISLNPQDWKDPNLYLSKTIKGWLQGLINQSDIERETEKKIIRGILEGGNNSPNLGSVKLVEDVVSTSAPGVVRTLRGGGGVRGKYAYKEFSDTVIGFVDASQSFTDRWDALNLVRQRFFDNLSREVAYAGANTPSWVNNNDFINSDLTTLLAKQRADIEAVAKTLSSKILALPPGPARDRLEKLFLKGVGRGTKFDSIFNESITKGANYGLVDILHQTSKAPARKFDLDYNNAFARQQFLDRLYSMDPNSGYFEDFKSFVISNHISLGFSSKQAAEEAFKLLKGRNLGEVVAKGLDPAIFGVDSLAKGGIAKGLTTQNDALLLKQIIVDLTDKIDSAKSEILEVQLSQFVSNPQQLINDMQTMLPGVDVNSIESMFKMVHYADTRARSLALEEFVTAVKEKNVIKLYFFLGKYNSILPKKIQKIKSQIDSLKIPLPVLNKYNVGDISTYLTNVKNKVAYKLGIAGYPGNMAYADLKGLHALTAFSPNNTYLHWADFAKDNKYMLAGSMNIELFPGRTFDSYADISKKFAGSGLFKNLRGASLQLFARDFEGLQDVYEASLKMANFLGPNVNQLHSNFEIFYNMWKTTGNASFLNNPAIFGPGISAQDLSRYQKAFVSIFKTLDRLHVKNGIDSKDFFSLIVYLSENKGWVLKTPKGFALARYMPILNQITNQLNYIQTYALNFLEKKVLNNTLFRIPLMKDLYTNMFRPGVGAYDRALELSKLLSRFAGKMGLKAAFGRLANSAGFKALSSLLSKILPGVLTATNLSTLGVTYLMYVIGRFGTGVIKSLFAAVRGNFKAIYYELVGFLKDSFVVPVTFFAKLLKWLILALIILILMAIIFIVFIFGGGPLNNHQRQITYEILFDEYGNRFTTRVVEGNRCIDLKSLEPSGGFKGKLNGYPVDSGSFSSCAYYYPDGTVHTGLDIAVITGTTVKSPYDGDAVVSGVYYDDPADCPGVLGSTCNGGWGNMVLLKVTDGGIDHYIRFAHLNSVSVKVGQVVTKGTTLGTSGNTGNSSGAHLHFEVLVGGPSPDYFVNPCAFSMDCSKYTSGGLVCDAKTLEGLVCTK